MVDFAQNVSTEVCRRPLVKDCDLPGEEICRTEYQSECWSKRIPHEVRNSQNTGHLPVSECVIVRKVKSLYTLTKCAMNIDIAGWVMGDAQHQQPEAPGEDKKAVLNSDEQFMLIIQGRVFSNPL